MKETIKQPEWLDFKRCIWINLCDNCKRYIIEKKLTKDQLNIFLCSNCRTVLIKHGESPRVIKGKPKVRCKGCNEYFVPEKYIGKEYCDKCSKKKKEKEEV